MGPRPSLDRHHAAWVVDQHPLDVFLEAPNPFVVEKGDPALPGAKQWWDMFIYQAISRGKAAPDNRNYCLTFDMIETGIFYNKTLFAQLGLKPPETWGEFIQIIDGDVYAGRSPDKLEIQRKPAQIQQTLWRPVFLNDYCPPPTADRDTPAVSGVPGPGDITRRSGPNASASDFRFSFRAQHSDIFSCHKILAQKLFQACFCTSDDAQFPTPAMASLMVPM